MSYNDFKHVKVQQHWGVLRPRLDERIVSTSGIKNPDRLLEEWYYTLKVGDVLLFHEASLDCYLAIDINRVSLDGRRFLYVEFMVSEGAGASDMCFEFLKKVCADTGCEYIELDTSRGGFARLVENKRFGGKVVSVKIQIEL